MKRKSSSTPDVSDEEECEDKLPVSDNPEMKVVEPIKGISTKASPDFGELDQKFANIQIPKAEETFKGESGLTLLDNPDEKIPNFTFSEPKGVETLKGKSISTFFSFEEKFSDSTFIKPKEEPLEGKPSSNFFGPERKSLDFIFSEPKAVESTKGESSSTFSCSGEKILDSTFTDTKLVESIKEKSCSTFFGSDVKSPDTILPESEPIGVEFAKETSNCSSSGSYDVVLDFDNRQDNVKGLILSERLRTCLKVLDFSVAKPDIDVLEVGVTGKVFIPVFLKGFASNELCLQNLVSMVDCRSYSDTNHIIPILFGVEPSEVRLETPLYREELDNLRGKVESMVVNRWTAALIDVSNISEQVIIPETARPGEIDCLVKEVYRMALHKLRLSVLSKGKCFVGMNRHVESIIDMLNLEVNDVRVIAISGANGVGKTTLARAVYDKLSSSFEGCSFLAGTRGENWIHDRINNLQAKLVSDLLRREVGVFESVDEGIDLIRERFCHMKVLIVLDNLQDPHYVEALVGHLNWFGPRSRIIITRPAAQARYIHLEHSIYDLSFHRPRPSDVEVLDLLNHHAFPKSYPFRGFYLLSQELSKAMTHRSDLSYLDIDIVGSFLYGKSKAEWERVLLNLRQQDGEFFKDVNGMLRMSYESLTEKQKEIFLDMSCLPDGMERRIALMLWDDYSYSTHSQCYLDFEVLIPLSLVKIDANDGIRMHRLIRDFGRDIIMQDPRWWLTPITGFVDLGSMRFFKMVHNGRFIIEEVYKKQRNFIERHQFPDSLEAEYHVKCLKILDLSRSKITEKWEAWGQIQAPQLRVLNLTYCVDLMVTPNFSFCPNLEMLILEHCSQLVEIDPSIKELQRLVTINLRYCKELSVLPKEMGQLDAVKELLIDGTSIQEIPITIGQLKKLQVLATMNCSSLAQLPSSTCNLLSITTLKLDCAKIAELPCSILQRLKLQYLSLRDCHGITNLGSFVGEVERTLVELDISRTSVAELPKSISRLKNLRVLKMDSCFIREFPVGFGELKKLEEVHASRCKRLESLPHDIGGIISLRILKVGHSRISSFPCSIQLLEHLEILDCTSCNRLQGFPGLPSNLTSLYVQSKEFKELPNLHNLVNLKEFFLGSDAVIIQSISLSFSASVVDPLNWLQLSVHMRILSLCLKHTKNLPAFPPFLRKLTLQCTNLENIPPFPSTLVFISIQNCKLLTELPNVESLQNLLEIEVICCPKIKKIKGLGRLKALQILTLLDSEIKELDELGELFSLRRLTLQDCRSLGKLLTVKRLESLLEMKIIGCLKVETIIGLGGLQNLQLLRISNCGIRSVIELPKLRSLTRLTITGCVSLCEVPNLSNLRSLKEKCVLLEVPQ